MKTRILIGMVGIALTLSLAGAAHAQANDLVCTQCVNTSDVADNAIGGAQLKGDSITSRKIGAGEVQSEDVADYSITRQKLKGNSVTSEKIGDGEVQSEDIADFSISTAKLKAGSVTETKLERTVQAKLTAPQIVLAAGGSLADTALVYGAGCKHPTDAEVTITVPGPGKIKVDAQALLYVLSHAFGEWDLVSVSLEDSNTLCRYNYWEPENGYISGSWFVSHTNATADQYEQISLSRIFDVSSAGTYSFYVNGEREEGQNASAGIRSVALQALYFPDL